MDKMCFKPYNDVELFSEFNYNICKKNFIREGLVNIFLSQTNIYTYKLLAEGFSILMIKEIIKKYKPRYNLLDIYSTIDNNGLVNTVEKKCKITSAYIDNLNSLDHLKILKNEFKALKFFEKPLIYKDLIKKEVYIENLINN